MKKFLSFISALLLISAVSCSEGKSESGEVMEIQVSEPEYTEDGKPVITIGSFGYIDPLFYDDFNKPTDVQIELVDFSEGLTPDYSTKEKEKAYYDAEELALDLALISGNAPDILCLPANDMQKMINQGVMTDLYGIMDEYDGLKREDFTECSLEGLTVDGKLPAIMERYIIWTAFAKTKFVSREYENWTASEAMDFYNKMPEFGEDMVFCRAYDEKGLADYMLKTEGLDCIDLKNNTCNFGSTFIELLDFCKNNPIKYSTYGTEDFLETDSNKLVNTLCISGLNSSLANKTYFYMNKDDITFVGYPSENGQGAYVEPSHYVMFGITEQCGNKEVAWDIVCRMMKHHKPLEKNEINDTIGVPTLKEEMQKDYDRSESYNNSINANIWTQNNEKEYLPAEVKEMLYEYILSVPANPYIPQSLEYIIDEECDPVIMGDRTAEDTAEILQNRISIYLSEKS